MVGGVWVGSFVQGFDSVQVQVAKTHVLGVVRACFMDYKDGI